MKLYEIPNMSKINCKCSDGSLYITFHHIDGMYSLCTTALGGVCHLAAWAQVEQTENGEYALKTEDKE